MLQYREPGIIVLNRGEHGTDSYPIVGHIAKFKRHPSLYQYNSYINDCLDVFVIIIKIT
jgi:hypothetical protein